MKKIRVALSAIGIRLFRNNVGVLKDKSGNYIQYGLCPGSSDMIGWTPLVVTQDMVGKKVAVFTAVEVKTNNGRLTDEQYSFLETVKISGGTGFVVRSVEEAIKLFS